jgi:RND family efflux transporter MFP subunit
MKRPIRAIVIAAVIVALAAGYFWFSRPTAPAKPEAGSETPPVIASVQTSPIRFGSIEETVTAYGTTAAAPGASQIVSVPFESRVRRVMVSNGQTVKSGQVLVELDPSPDTALQYSQAESAHESARQNLTRVRERYDLRLATNEQLLAAGQSERQVALQIESLRRRGIADRQLRAVRSGLVWGVEAKEGSLVPAGGSLLEIIDTNRLQARLGIEPEKLSDIKPGQKVVVSYVTVAGSRPFTGSVVDVSRSINPATRLIDVFVALPAPAQVLIDQYVSGAITVRSASGLIVPRRAVLPAAAGQVIYTVESSRVKEHVVTLGVRNDAEVQVSAAGLRPGLPVVAVGNYELRDGMAVQEMREH